MANEAAWIDALNTPLRVAPAEKYTPGPNEILVKNEVIGINPLEGKQARFPIRPLNFPTILGMSFAGTVEAVGSDITNFAPGDRIAASTPSHIGDPRYGGFQKYALADPRSAFKLFPETSASDGAIVITNLVTAITALNITLGLARAPTSGEKAEKKEGKVLIYGGSSSVGGFAVKYATDAGYEVVTTSSPQNKDFVASMGPVHIVDHTQGTEAIVAELESHGPYIGFFDAVGAGAAAEVLSTLLDRSGGGEYSTVLPPMGPRAYQPPESVKVVFHPYSILLDQNEELREWVFGTYIPWALNEGKVVPTRSEKVNGGLGAMQTALEKVLGVSGRKLVVYPWE
ncbi:putative alcohol dehydrogenase [Patellaria atrata CBS 101060]|uniref:Alcohol dehydrogenase n=1 Tax=Patellaria atrata CBS 101060 TaxID=1346257 RepID=A0A9P4S8C4_9PEZI|nr:putative alcohol dehydrogenase [Patellaria atrata CBS 101060]